MNLKQFFNPVWRKARNIRDLVTGNPDIREALKELTDLIISKLLEAALGEALRRRLVVPAETVKLAAKLLQGGPK